MMPEPDPFDLQRFVDAQREIYADALAELRAGRKQTHWMWFIFPQVRGLGSSGTSRHFGIRSADEARAYLAHATLGPRLIECVDATLALAGRTAHDIFGSPDDLKFGSSLTLFAHVSPPGSVFARALAKYFEARPDPRTLELVHNE